MGKLLEIYDVEEIPNGISQLKFTTLDPYQWEDPVIQAKLIRAKYKKVSFRGVRNTITLITYQDKIVIPQKIQKYVLHWYHTYLLHTGIDWTDTMILKHLFKPVIIDVVQK